MGYKYNDLDMMMATQVAYLDMKPRQTVEDAIRDIESRYASDPNNAYYKKQHSVVETMLEISDGDMSKYNCWKIKDVGDDNDGTGFYACLIETGQNKDPIIGFRGSESYNTDQISKDWVDADFGMLNNPLTEQQKKAEEYMAYLYKEYGDDYNSFSVSGHSLGGELAEHATVMAPDGMKDKIDHTISFDGPGFSDEYISAHWDEIHSVSDKMDHYQWSLISSVLNPLPGVKDTVVKAHDDFTKDGLWIKIIGHLLPKPICFEKVYRHATYNVELDENGNVQNGTESLYSIIIGPISRIIESLSISGEVYVDNGGVAGVIAQLEETSKAVDSAKRAIFMYEEKLKYDTIASSYLRTKMIIELAALELDVINLNKMIRVLNNALEKYAKAEQKVVELF